MASADKQWAPPKNPLPPHRLARLANALGVSTPMPAIHVPSSSYNGSNPPGDQFRRSPTPSTATSFAFASSSKYLLHVIPPINLPHDADAFDSDMTPPPSTASGYHSHFRRGTLVPFHSTLQSQLGAIAKEYALPSTAGLVLYLVSQPAATEKPPSFPEQDEPPGPRLSEEIWRHLWARVAKSESREEGLAPPLLGLGLGVAGRSTPYLHQSNAYPLPFLSSNGSSAALQPQASYPFTPSPTTPSSTSDIPRFITKSAPPSSSSLSDADGDANRRDTETPATSRADSLDLPGLGTDSLIPILAKVEFDIDRKRAGWFEPWLRSRRMNQAKRTRSVSTGGDDGRRGPMPFKLKGKRTGSPESLAAARARYLPLSDSPQSMNDSDSEEEPDARVRDFDEDDDTQRGGMIGRSSLAVDRPGMSNRSSPSRRRGPPTPLILHQPPNDAHSAELGGSSDGTPPETDEEGRTILPYLDPERDLPEEQRSRKTPERRGGGFYDDMDLGFSSDDLDDDPNDRRKSQFIMRAQLDEIEKNLAQFSPRQLQSELSPHDRQKLTLAHLATSPTLSPPRFSPQSAISPSEVFRALSNSDVFPPTPRLPEHPDKDGNGLGSDEAVSQAAWPAVPFNSLPDRAASNERSPPRLAVNGVSASVPKRFRAGGNATGPSAPSETDVRKRELAEEHAATAYPAMTPSVGKSNGSLNSPLIPLSPDPFGRHPSQPPDAPNVRNSGTYWDKPMVIPAPKEPSPPPTAGVQRKASEKSESDKSSSRFSTDSMSGSTLVDKQANRTTIMSVKGIKSLWRKSHKSSPSLSGSKAPGAKRISTVQENTHLPLSPPAPARPNRPSMEEMQFPDVDVPVPRTPLTPGFAPPPSPRPGAAAPTSRPSLDQPRPIIQRRPSQMLDHVPPTPPPPSPSPVVPAQRRPSQDELRMQSAARRPSEDELSAPQLRPPITRAPSHPALNALSTRPPPMLHSTNQAPIVAAKAGPPRKAFGDELTWDQESPYPTRMSRAPSVASMVPSRPPSAASQHHSSPTPPPVPASPPLPSTLQAPQTTGPRSILKLKPPNGAAPAVPAPLTPSATTFRAKRPSHGGNGSISGLGSSPSQGSPLVLPPDIPPSPKLPEQFINSQPPPSRSRPNSAAIMRRRLSAKMASTATDSSRRHRAQESQASANSRASGSEETHESTSLDNSAFEIVSPKMGGTLSFPYTDADERHS
uniref:Proteophosphoglycan ppg4 n=1 Tax=Mycena chlorophos TaxID=658473 RepID=A0ABQ0KZ81_MYCCL|nr:predicted protein [Mycena chlorophos]